MDNQTRCVEYVDKVEFEALKQEVQALRRKLENVGKSYGPWNFPDNQKYTLDVMGINGCVITLANKEK